jgi:hypothetical protein
LLPAVQDALYDGNNPAVARPVFGIAESGSGLLLSHLRLAAGSGRGKRGGIRVIYYLWHRNTAFMLAAYPKNQQTDLSPAQLKVLKNLLEEYTHE